MKGLFNNLLAEQFAMHLEEGLHINRSSLWHKRTRKGVIDHIRRLLMIRVGCFQFLQSNLSIHARPILHYQFYHRPTSIYQSSKRSYESKKGLEVLSHTDIIALSILLQKMEWWLLLLLLLIPLAHASCAAQCGSCSIDQSPYTCLTCSPASTLTYLSSCPKQNEEFTIFIAVVAVITVLHLFMLAMGIGIYREVFENIQMASLITWRYGFQGGTFALQGTNLAMVRNNEFIEIFGYQFLGLCILFLLFWLALAVVGKVSQSPTAILLRRKRIIFPVRVFTFVFNMVLFASLAQVTTASFSTIKPLSFGLGVTGIVASASILVYLGVISSNKRFQADDPHYYVLVQQMVSKRWWARNNTFISLFTRAGIIIAFTSLFQTPQIAGMVMLSLQFLYSVYFIATIRFNKIRYFVVLSINTLMLIAIILASYLGAIAPLHSQAWYQTSKVYLALYLCLIGLFFLASAAEVFLRRELIIKQIKSIYQRFLRCETSQEKIIVSKYDEGSHRERVSDFKRNLLYQQPVRIEMAVLS